jgi:hypothetical protein
LRDAYRQMIMEHPESNIDQFEAYLKARGIQQTIASEDIQVFKVTAFVGPNNDDYETRCHFFCWDTPANMAASRRADPVKLAFTMDIGVFHEIEQDDLHCPFDELVARLHPINPVKPGFIFVVQEEEDGKFYLVGNGGRGGMMIRVNGTDGGRLSDRLIS